MKTQLNMFGLNIVDNLKRNVLIVSETSVTNKDQTYLLKLNTSEQEVRLLRDCFPKINQRDFGVLQLPVAHRVGSLFNNKDWWVIMDYFKGESINWDERNPECIGGKNISLDYINVLTGILADLKSIDIGLFSGVLPSVESAPWYTSLKNKLTKLISCQLFPPSYRQKAINMIEFGLSGESKKDLILTNGDFQFRNFIKLTNGKIAVIDWTENSYNTPNIEPLEFAAMYQWTLMWANIAWQNAYIKKITNKFGISKDRLKFSLLIKSINQAHLWRGAPELAKIQVSHSIQALEGQI